MSSTLEKLMFQPFSSLLNPGFWQQLTRVKLNELKLSHGPVPISGSYACNLSESLPCLASFDHSAFDPTNSSTNKSTCKLNGDLICTNQLQEFLDFDKKKFLDTYGQAIWQAILDGRAAYEPEKYLAKVGLLVYADLKKYKYYYWFAFPALNYPTSISIASSKPIAEVLEPSNIQVIQDELEKTETDRSISRSYFAIKRFIENHEEHVKLLPLHSEELVRVDENETSRTRILFAFLDPSADAKYPGWPLRNYLCLIAKMFGRERISILRIRRASLKTKGVSELNSSIVMNVQLGKDQVLTKPDMLDVRERPRCSGWERNESQLLAPKRVNLSSLLDPKRLAEDAVSLNLKLMKWRLVPDLDLDKIANTKTLILGCGTLGCHVARGLLAWGIKELSLLDNSKVSYSNPVRQSLYTFADCSNSDGVYKAHAAAACLKNIHPTAKINPIVMSIPMPGHHIAEGELDQTKKDVAKLETLIDNHDVIFLLMDTRESRWLPSVIALSKQKMVINAAIGFDTFLLQRYGVREYKSLEQDPDTLSPAKSQKNFLTGDKLGCYFCNDIVAPGDSTLDRTLDQQCTVSRPGVSMMVSAMAVELLASILGSKYGPNTPAPLDLDGGSCELRDQDECFGELGIVPHSIRGNIARYHIYMPTSPAFNKCSACSLPVIDTYQRLGFEFLQRVFDDPAYLEEVAGLKDLQNVDDNVWALDSDEDSNKFGED